MNTMTLDRIAPVASTSSTQFVIQSNIPLPPRTYGPGASAKYPFAAMRVGDSFAVSIADYNSRGKTPATVDRVQGTLMNCAYTYARSHDRRAKFSTRKISDTTVRIWRVA